MSRDASLASVARLYDELVADHYDDDAFAIISGSRKVALEQIKAAKLKPRRVCDFGMGTGDAIVDLRRDFTDAEMWGVDISRRMIDRARVKLTRNGGLQGISLILGDAIASRDVLPKEPMDLALTHFLLNYVDGEKMAARVAETLAKGGVWSILTSTRDSFPRLAGLARQFLPPDSQPELHTNVPEKIETVEGLAAAYGFEIVDTRSLTHPIHFDNFDALVHFARHSGWFTSEALARFTPEEIERLRPDLEMLFPLHDEARVAAVLSIKK